MEVNKAYQPDEDFDSYKYPDQKNGTLDFDDDDDAESIPEKKSFAQKFHEYPKSIIFIFGNEFCERFSYYGMQAVLTLYFLNYLKLDKNTSASLYQGFGALCYFTPILGCILADGYIGKFHTILWVSLIYACGNIVISVAASIKKGTSIHPALDFVGLIIIAFGTGGIKPCVVAFGGDQFRKGQEKWLERFFSVFYISINAGSCISTFITPMFRAMPCNGEDSCYPLAFGVPAGLMVCSCIFFVFGSFWYRKTKPRENVLGEVAKVIVGAIRNKIRFNVPREKFLEHYLDDHSCAQDVRCQELKHKGTCHKEQFVKDIRAVLRLLIMYIPLPVFWALYNQQGGKWIIQGTEMRGKMGSVRILPDQVPTINPILIMAFIPIFSFGVYPLFGLCFKITPLRKMSAGGFLAVVSYVVTALVQMKINKTLPIVPDPGHARITFINYINEDISVRTTAWASGKLIFNETIDVPFNSTNSSRTLQNVGGATTVAFQVFNNANNSLSSQPIIQYNSKLKSRGAYYVPIAQGNMGMFDEPLEKPTNGEGEAYFTFNYFIPGYKKYNETFMILCLPKDESIPWDKSKGCTNIKDKTKFYNISIESFNVTDKCMLKPGRWLVYLPQDPLDNKTRNFPNKTAFKFDVIKEGAIETMTIYGATPKDITHDTYQLTGENTVSLLWQIPQYVIVTAAEILFSITGLEFSYSQAPSSMKSVLQAVWLLSVAFGNIIIIIIVQASTLENQAYNYFIFAGIMFVVMILFVLLSVFYYEYVSYDTEEHEDDSKEAADAKDKEKQG